MKTKNLISAFIGAFILLSQVSFGQISNGTFSSGNTGFTSEYFQQSSPFQGEYDIVTTSYGISGWNVFSGNGKFMIIDGYNDEDAPKIVWEMSNTFTATTSNYTFNYDIITRIFSGQPMDIDLTIELVNNSTNAVEYSVNKDEGQLNIWTSRNTNLPCTIGNIYRIRIVQRNTNEQFNDFALDNISMCEGLNNPSFTINDENDNPLNICNSHDIRLNITKDPNATNYFVSILDLTTQTEHMRWLTSNEMTQSGLANFNLTQMAANSAYSSINPLTSSPNMPLIIGRCYSVKVVAQNECSSWVSTIREFCLGEECNVHSRISMEDLCNPIRLYAAGASSGTSYFWSFGDGTSSTLQNPVHQYAQSGTYTITLLVHKNTLCGTCCDATSMEVNINCGEFNGETLTWAAGGKEFKTVPTGAIDTEEGETDDFKVYPNPANEQTQISFLLDQKETVSLMIYNSTGKLISTIINQSVLAEGLAKFDINTSTLPAGMYHVILTTETQRQTRSFTITK